MNLKIILLLFFPFLLFAQNEISLKIKDPDGNPIQRAIVIVSQQDKQINYGTTNADGIVNLILPTGNFILTINKLGFEQSITAVIINKPVTFTITLLSLIHI